MAEPTTPGEARRQGLNKSRWIAGGVAVGAAALLTGVIAGANGAGSGATSTQQEVSAAIPGSTFSVPRYDDHRESEREYDDDFEDARPYTPSQQQAPSAAPQRTPSYGPQTRSGGS